MQNREERLVLEGYRITRVPRCQIDSFVGTFSEEVEGWYMLDDDLVVVSRKKDPDAD